jgi:hypothetical protein
MPSDGSVSFPKIRSPPNATKGSSTDDGSGEASPGQKVAELCGKLGLAPPTYEIIAHKEFPSMYSGYAHFGGHLLTKGRIGEFENVYGRTNARVECAKGVLVFLQGVLRAREEGARPGVAGKVGKVEGTAGVEGAAENEKLVDVGAMG